ncbi:MAG: GAF domain-containing protein, partial [Sulfurovum sp.]|nr:GAF domain-containing protein [Sulfurovum sp.]
MTQPSSEKINDNTSFQAFVPAVSRWLAWQCEMISEVKIGTVFLRSNTANNNLKMFASWPENVSDSIEGKLYDLAQDVIDGKNNIMPKMTCDAGQGDMVYDTTTLPLHYNNKVVGAVIFLQSVRSEDQKKAVFQLFQWGCALLESTLTDMYEEQHKFHPLVTDLAKLALQDAPVALIGHQICNLLAQQLGCKRVVLGTMQGLQVHTLALSNQLRFDTRASHISEMEAVMEEALDQDQAILYPKSEEMFSSVTQKHQTLSADNEDASLLTIPFSNAENAIGAILLLRPRNNPFTKEEVKAVQYATQLLGSSFSLKLRDEYSFLNLLVQSFKKKTQPVFGTGHL